ncbi:MAG: GC-type dockerin domain-anchored protein [Planctomycetota bacterium]
MHQPRAIAAACSFVLCAGSGAAQPVIDLPPETVAPGSDLPDGATVNVFEGGVIPLGVDLSDGVLNVLGGDVALGATGISTGFTNSSNVVTVSAGNVGGFFQLTNGTELTVTGGEMESFGVFSGSSAAITGGTVSRFPDVFSSGTVNLSGGDVLAIRAFAGSTINIAGSQFELDGETIEGLSETPTLLTDRGGVLTVMLEDGTPFEWTLRTFDPGFFAADPGLAATGATVNLVLTSPVCLPDVNNSGTLDGSDFFAWVVAFGDGDPAADQNLDGLIDGSDFFAWVANFGAGCDF